MILGIIPKPTKILKRTIEIEIERIVSVRNNRSADNPLLVNILNKSVFCVVRLKL